MRIGEEGDAQGFQEAHDGILGFVIPYIKSHTGKEGDPTKVKIWASGFSSQSR